MTQKSYLEILKNSFKLLAAVCLLAGSGTDAGAHTAAQSRKQLFDQGWKFHLGDDKQAAGKNYNDRAWRTLDLPHDWSIEGRVDRNNPSGNDGGYYPAGTGWYRKTFTLPHDIKNRKTGLYFEGVYMNAEVFVNGKKAGGHPYGYSSFFVDITPFITAGANTVAVRVDNSQQKNCRWYSGSGIYRHVWLTATGPVHIARHGVFITTQSVNGHEAVVQVRTTVSNETSSTRKIALSTNLKGRNNTAAAEETTDVELPAGASTDVVQNITVRDPQLWSTDSPNLYNAVIALKDSKGTLDAVSQTFGIRTIEYSATKGLLLNGREVKLSGGCLHHDNGMLGAAAYDRAEERKVELMKSAGFNALRTSHNPPSEAMLEACDRLGMLVIDEAFDGWRDSKTKFDYSTLFDRWWHKDIEAMVLRDRNHPSIFCWSIGNEVIERKKLEVVTTAKKLADHIRKFDNTRPVTSALASWDSDWEIYDPLAAVHDIVGYNYLLDKAPSDHLRVPSRVIMQTESYPNDAFKNWKLVSENKYITGDFVWTAIDYLGESGIGRYYYEGDTPGEHYQHDQFPWHGAYCGDIDITGWRKPVSHYREMLYNERKKLYMAVREPDGYYGKIKNTLWSVWPTWESWTWPGHEGKPVEVEVCSRYPQVRLYLNGKLIGEKPAGVGTEFKAVFKVRYEQGELVAAGVEDGVEKERSVLHTAGAPAAISLSADRKTIKTDGQDLVFVTVEIKDKNGNTDPNAARSLTFNVSGAGTLAAAGSADLKDTTPYNATTQKTWKGRAMLVIKSNRKAGAIRLKVSSPGLPSATLSLKSVR